MARSTSKAVVRLNTQAIRKKALQAHRKAERALEQLKADLKRYHEQDVPGFRVWMHRTFGDLLTRQRECQQAIAEKMALAGEVDEIVTRYGLSYPQAYRKVMWRRAHPEEAEAEDRKQAESWNQQAKKQAAEHPEQAFDEDDAWDDDDLDDEAAFEQWLGDLMSEPARKVPGGDAPNPDQTTARELYRSIVRHLHPDHHGKLSDARAALWHEAQEAYRRQDLSTLHSILVRCEDGVAALGAHTPVSLILRMTKQLLAAARSSRGNLRNAKRDIAWRYEERLEDRKYIRRIEQDLLEVLNKAQWMLDEINFDLANLERQANRQDLQNSRPKRKTPHSASLRPSRQDSQDELPF